MSDLNDKCLELFPKWLGSLGEDLRIFVGALRAPNLSEEAKRYLLGGVNYLFKSLDLIPDGIDDIGYLDDAFVLRLSAKGAVSGDVGELPVSLREQLSALSEACALIEDFLGEGVYKRLQKYTDHLRNGAARGRMVNEMVTHADTLGELLKDAEQFIESYEAPSFAHDEKNLIKMTAFFEAKLPK